MNFFVWEDSHPWWQSDRKRREVPRFRFYKPNKLRNGELLNNRENFRLNECNRSVLPRFQRRGCNLVRVRCDWLNWLGILKASNHTRPNVVRSSYFALTSFQMYWSHSCSNLGAIESFYLDIESLLHHNREASKLMAMLKRHQYKGELWQFLNGHLIHK